MGLVVMRVPWPSGHTLSIDSSHSRGASTPALWSEGRPRGVKVIALCPGATETPFFTVVGAEEASFGKRRTPEQVVATALRGLAGGKRSIVDGRSNALLARFQRFLPRRVVLTIAERSVRPRNAA